MRQITCLAVIFACLALIAAGHPATLRADPANERGALWKAIRENAYFKNTAEEPRAVIRDYVFELYKTMEELRLYGAQATVRNILWLRYYSLKLIIKLDIYARLVRLMSDEELKSVEMIFPLSRHRYALILKESAAKDVNDLCPILNDYDARMTPETERQYLEDNFKKYLKEDEYDNLAKGDFSIAELIKIWPSIILP